jgi:ABC-type sugar transport system permease subunit
MSAAVEVEPPPQKARKARVGSSSADMQTRRDRWLSVYLALPAILLLGLAQLYPLVQGILYSFQKGKAANPSQAWIGLKNFRLLLHNPDFWAAARFSLIFAIGGVLLSYTIGLVLALVLVREFPMRGFLRVGFVLPWIIPPIVGMTALRWMMQDDKGAVNQVLHWFGVPTIFFFNDPKWTVVATILAKAWRSFPFMLVSLMAALQALDPVLEEAAVIDGANRWQTFWRVTFPQILPMSAILWVLMLIWSVNDYETPYLLTNNSASARNLMIFSFDEAIYRNLGTGSASAVLTLIVLGILAFFMLRLQKKASDLS